MVRAADKPSARPGLVGALLMVVATFCFVSLDSILKLLATRHDVLFLTWGRNLFQVLYVAALMPWTGVRRTLATRHPRVQIARGAMLAGSTVFIVLALRSTPLAQTYAITFSAPFMATILAALFLNERPSRSAWIWILLGLAGVVIALQPGAPQAGLALVFPLAMAAANACYHVLTRAIAKDEEPLAMLFYVGFFAFLLTTVSLPWSWSTATAADWGLLAIGGLFGTLAHLLVIQAFRLAPMAVVSPMIYSQIIAACLLGYVVFGEVPTVMTLLGAGIVIASGCALIRERA